MVRVLSAEAGSGIVSRQADRQESRQDERVETASMSMGWTARFARTARRGALAALQRKGAGLPLAVTGSARRLLPGLSSVQGAFRGGCDEMNAFPASWAS
jgi:hypothetical protein